MIIVGQGDSTEKVGIPGVILPGTLNEQTIDLAIAIDIVVY